MTRPNVRYANVPALQLAKQSQAQPDPDISRLDLLAGIGLLVLILGMCLGAWLQGGVTCP